MSGLFNRLKNWIDLETVTNDDLNAEFNNIIEHFTPLYIDDYSASISQMQEVLSPGGVGTEVQATNLSEELKQLRYMIRAITGEAQWYSPPTSTIAELSSLFSSPNHRVVSGRVDTYKQPMWLVPNGAAATVSLQAASTNLESVINGTEVTFNSNVSKTSLTTAPSSNNTCLVNQSALAGQSWSKFLGEGDSVIPIDTVGSEISGLNGMRAAFKVVHGGGTEYFIADIDTTTGVLKNCFRGYFFDSADAVSARIAIHDNDTITLMKLTWVFATYNSSVQALDATYTQPVISFDTPAAPASGDYWFDLANNRWKKYSGSFSSTDAVFVGVCFQDSTNCLGARSVDPYKAYSDLNGIEMDRVSASVGRSRKVGATISSYGNLFLLDPDNGKWNMATDLDTGVVEAASTTYFFYVTSQGDRVISDIAPYDRYFDLKGAYHPYRPYRCVGSVRNDGSSNFLTTIGSERRIKTLSPNDVQNAGVRCSVAANALTIELTTADGSDPSAVNPVICGFKSTTATDGYVFPKRVENSLSLTVPNTATLGTQAVENCYVNFFLAMTAAGRLLPLVSGMNLGGRVDGLQLPFSATTLDTGADVAATYYGELSGSTTVSGVSVATLISAQGTAGVWATLPTVAYAKLKAAAGSAKGEVRGNGTSNHGTTDTSIRRIGADGTTTMSDDYGSIAKIVTNAGNGTVMTVYRAGIYSISYEDCNTGGAGVAGISLNSSQLTTSFFSITTANQLAGVQPGSNLIDQAHWCGYLPAGSIVRPHDDGAENSPSVHFLVHFLGEV